MTVKRIFVAMLVAAGLVLVNSVAADAAAPTAQPAPVIVAPTGTDALVDSCAPSVMGSQPDSFQMHNYFRCLGDWHNLGGWGPTAGTTCLNLSGMVAPSHPAPNGFSNMMSSGFNQTVHRLEFHDAFNCGGAILFAMEPNTYRDTLNTIANNKASSVRIRNI